MSIAATVCAASTARTQSLDFFLGAGPDDAQTLLGYYMEPLVMGFSYGMSNGWANSARSHKFLGFDLTVSASFAPIPLSREYFIFNPSEYSNVTVAGEGNRIPTIMGPSGGDGPELIFSYKDENTGNTFTTSFRPEGLGLKSQIGFNAVPTPMVQLSIGTFANTDLIIRYAPEISAGNFSSQLFGLGIKHDIKQWIPVLRRMPLDLAILGAFSGFDNRLDLQDSGMEGTEQSATFNVNNWTVQGMISKKISILTFYGSVGYSAVCTGLKLNGTYTLTDTDYPEVSATFHNPVDLTYEQSSWRATAGLRVKAGFITLHGDYTLQQYPLISAGLGISVR